MPACWVVDEVKRALDSHGRDVAGLTSGQQEVSERATGPLVFSVGVGCLCSPSRRVCMCRSLMGKHRSNA